MNKQETSVYYMIYNRTEGRSASFGARAYDYPTALEEARRLAKINPGAEYVILKAFISVMVTVPEPTITTLG